MLHYNSHCLFEDKNKLVYSCDMVRLVAYLPTAAEDRDSFSRYMSNPVHIRISDVCTTFALGKFRYLWTITCVRTSITVLHHFNAISAQTDENSRMVVLEFNPNKLEYEDFRVVDTLLSMLVDVSVKRLDLAIDMPILREHVHLIKDSRTYKLEDHNKNGITEYLGARNTTDYVKLYDKMRESSLDGALSRLEFTCEPDIVEFRKHFPKVLVEFEQLGLELLGYGDLSSTQMLTVRLLNRLPIEQRMVELKRLNYRMRKKISPHVLTGSYELAVDYSCVSSVFGWVKSCVNNKRFTP